MREDVIKAIFSQFCIFVGKSGAVWGILCIFDPEFYIIDVRMRFIGTIEAKLDAKGRVFLPAMFRKVMQSSGEEVLVLRKDVFQPCLVLYTEMVWNEQMDALRARLNRWNTQHQQIFRQFVSDAETVVLDSNGRFLLPKRFLKELSLGQDVRFVGMGDTIEIWNGQNADEVRMDSATFGQALAEVMADIEKDKQQNGEWK